MTRKIYVSMLVFTTLLAASVQCLADNPSSRIMKQQERYTISVALEIHKKNRNSLVRILSSLSTVAPNAYGSGFVVGDGLVMTSYHVVSGRLSDSNKLKLGFKPEDELEVKAYVNGCEARTVKVDEEADLALLRICAQSNKTRSATFAPVPANGEQVLLIAQPGTQKMVRRGSFHGTYNFRGFDYLSARIEGQDGFSGSPIYDSKGEIVGVFCCYDWKRGLALISPADKVQKLLSTYDSSSNSNP